MAIGQRFSPLVQIKAGNEAPAIFIAHGLSGTVQVSELAMHIRTSNPIYGIQAKGIDGIEAPLDRVEEMAELYRDAIEKLPIQEPYILIGYSFGGLVALEMAHGLLEKGKTVALLVLLDTYPHPRFMPAPQRLRLFVRRMMRHAHQMRQLPLPEAVTYFVNGVKRRLRLASALQESQNSPETSSLSSAEIILRRVNQKLYSAYANYRPKFYRGKIQFVTTETRSFFPSDPATVWAQLAAELEVEVVPGDHLNIVTSHFEPLAAVLTGYVRRVTSRDFQPAS